MGLFRKKTRPQQEESAKPFRFELGWRGMFGLVIVCFCLFLWMFLLGIWAGQTILLPSKENRSTQSVRLAKPLPAKTAQEATTPPKEEQRSNGL
ncbi:MAG: hypothetical protein JZU50_15795 [Desulfobulbaceae bacterium]|nr:hypothetical protein [Desulfobulbaceae bacterium]